MLNAQPVSFSWSFFAFVCVFIHMFFVAIFQCSNFRFIAPAYFLVWKCFNILFRKSRRNAANLMAHIYFALLNLLFAESPTRSLHSLPFCYKFSIFTFEFYSISQRTPFRLFSFFIFSISLLLLLVHSIWFSFAFVKDYTVFYLAWSHFLSFYQCGRICNKAIDSNVWGLLGKIEETKKTHTRQ